MGNHIDKSIKIRDITGTGVAVGENATAIVNIGRQERDEIRAQLTQLRAGIEAAALAEGVKKVLLKNVIPPMEQAVESDQAKAGLEGGLTRINDQLESAAATAGHVSGILTAVQTIAEKAGIALAAAAPFLARLLGLA